MPPILYEIDLKTFRQLGLGQAELGLGEIPDVLINFPVEFPLRPGADPARAVAFLDAAQNWEGKGFEAFNSAAPDTRPVVAPRFVFSTLTAA